MQFNTTEYELTCCNISLGMSVSVAKAVQKKMLGGHAGFLFVFNRRNYPLFLAICELY